MNRRDLVKSTLLAAGALSSRGIPAQEVTGPHSQKHARSFPSPPVKTNGERMPNILWIVADSQRADTLGGLNNPHIKTPNLDKFVAESVTCTNAFVQCPICAPSRASMLAGRYPHTTGLRANGQRIRADERLVTRILADYDYGCGLVGKLHLSPCALGQVENRIDDGYQVFEWSHDLTDSWPGQNAWLNWLQKQNVKWPGNAVPAPKQPIGLDIDPKYTQTAWCGRARH